MKQPYRKRIIAVLNLLLLAALLCAFQTKERSENGANVQHAETSKYSSPPEPADDSEHPESGEAIKEKEVVDSTRSTSDFERRPRISCVKDVDACLQKCGAATSHCDSERDERCWRTGHSCDRACLDRACPRS